MKGSTTKVDDKGTECEGSRAAYISTPSLALDVIADYLLI